MVREPRSAHIAVAPAPTVLQLAGITLPGDATLSITTTRDPDDPGLVDLAVDGAVGHARILGWGHFDFSSHRAGGASRRSARATVAKNGENDAI